jgi:hypothetical protein
MTGLPNTPTARYIGIKLVSIGINFTWSKIGRQAGSRKRLKQAPHPIGTAQNLELSTAQVEGLRRMAGAKAAQARAS